MCSPRAYVFSGLISLKDCGLRDYKRPFLQHSCCGPWWKTRAKCSSHNRGLSQFLSPYPPSNSSSIPQRRSKPFKHHNCISRGGIHFYFCCSDCQLQSVFNLFSGRHLKSLPSLQHGPAHPSIFRSQRNYRPPITPALLQLHGPSAYCIFFILCT